MDYFRYSYLILFTFLIPVLSAFGQSGGESSYKVNPRPDIWYNSPDGIRFGLFLEGRDILADGEGKHRLDAALWLSTRWPDYPVSYHLSLEEPVKPLSNYGSEFLIRAASTRIDGYQSHLLSVGKRWQPAFTVTKYWELSLSYSFEQRFDNAYVLFRDLWRDDWKRLLKLRIRHQQFNGAGRFLAESDLSINTTSDFFSVATVSLRQEVGINGQWKLHLRGYAGIAGSGAYPEYRFMKSFAPAISNLESPLTRSRGTLPTSWIESGLLHRAGGPNLRGYTRIDSRELTAGRERLYRSIGAVNIEMDIPNPVQHYFRQRGSLLDMISFRTYLFSDTGFPLGLTSDEPSDPVSDAGIGLALSFNIPDIDDKPRGFVIRYELPVWLSSPVTGRSLKLRHLIGVGAVITF